MSSLTSRAPATAQAQNQPRNQPAAVMPYAYCEVTAQPRGNLAPAGQGGGETEVAASLSQTSLSQTSLSQMAVREAQARELGRRQGELEARAKFEEQLARERAAVAQALGDFSRERAAYYQKIEKEAVQLALSIARKILHREAQVDPLLLMGILRVALERIEGATGVVLAVHPQQAVLWRKYLISRLGPGELLPEILEDPAMALEQCQLRTSMGTADLGLEVQLKEIEQGLMDLLAARPQGKP
jgi:flagellar biosynthesis/type III secretory pathway protein FliH